MKYRPLGSTGLEVSALCLGTWPLSGDWGSDVSGAVAGVRRAHDLGVNFFDTAHVMGDGAADRGLAAGLGDVLRTKRDQVYISAKGGIGLSAQYPGRTERSSDRQRLRAQLEASLTALGTDYVDVFFIHWPDADQPLEETAAAVQSFVDAGLIRFVGLSNHDIAQLDEFARTVPCDVVELPYSLLARGIESDLLPYASGKGLGIMTWSALAHGLLGGELQRDSAFPADDWRSGCRLFQGETWDALHDVLEPLAALARELGSTVPALALAWILSSPDGVVPIIGAQTAAHVDSSAAAVDIELSPSDVERIRAIVASSPSIALPEQFPLRRNGEPVPGERQWGS